MEEEDVNRRLIQVEPKLLVDMEVDLTLLSHLAAEGVITDYHKYTLKCENDKMERVSRLMSHVRRDLRRLNPLLHVLRKVDQHGVAHVITRDLLLDQHGYVVISGTEQTGHQAEPTGHQAESTGDQAEQRGHQSEQTGHQAELTGDQAELTGDQPKPKGYQSKPTGPKAGPRTQPHQGNGASPNHPLSEWQSNKEADYVKGIRRLHEENESFLKEHYVLKGSPDTWECHMDLSQVFTPLNLAHLEKSVFYDSKEIDLKEALTTDTKCTFFSGVPGNGKTCLLLHIMTEMVRTGQNQTNGMTKTIFTNIENVFYIRREDCFEQETVADTVRMIIKERCGDKHEDAVWERYRLHPERTALVFDSLDEIYGNKTLLKDIFKVMKERKQVVLAGVRENHPVIDDALKVVQRESAIRTIKVKGFKKDTIMTYIDKFFEGYQDGAMVESFKATVDSDTSLQGLMTNPLFLCLVCILLRKQDLKVEELTGITRLDVFTRIEKLFAKREDLVRGNEDLKEEDRSSIHSFHKFCLKMLLSEDSLYLEKSETRDIKPHHMPFMTIKTVCLYGKPPSSPGEPQNLVLPHRSFVEFGAAKYIMDSSEDVRNRLLVYIAGQQKFNDLLSILLELLQLSHAEYKGIINTTLALQPDIQPTGRWHWIVCATYGNKKLKQILQDLDVNLLLKEDSAMKLFGRKLGDIWPCWRCWKNAGHAWTMEGRAITQNARTIINMVPGCQQEILNSSLGPLFPPQLGACGLDLRVPESESKISVRPAHCDGMTLTMSHPADVLATKAFSVWGNWKLKMIEIITRNKAASGRCETHEDWKGMFHELIRSTPRLQDGGSVNMKPASVHCVGDIIGVVTDLQPSLSQHGIKDIRLDVSDSERLTPVGLAKLGIKKFEKVRKGPTLETTLPHNEVNMTVDFAHTGFSLKVPGATEILLHIILLSP